MDELSFTDIRESREWAQRAIEDVGGPKWRELTPLLMWRIPIIVGQYESLVREVEYAKQQLTTALETVEQNKKIIQEFMVANETVVSLLKEFCDTSLSPVEMFVEAVRAAARQIHTLRLEREAAQESLYLAQELAGAQASDLLVLQDTREQLAYAKARTMELQTLVDETHQTHEIARSRIQTLEDQNEDMRDEMSRVRADYEDRVADLRAELSRANDHSLLVEVDKWKDRALQAEEEKRILEGKLRRTRETIQDVLVQ